ncbi:hypothetical protein QJS10_CPA05g01909 [Acorus calamus]|uniref:Signal recognition particle subunit SRP72 n=1 Tax=Acorus calamus TaxID=4465 RepID=A0AAV9EUU4_ACOCL|nr:hypothetical protein QJS10_CPA05g01909 [Acorus calamus]
MAPKTKEKAKPSSPTDASPPSIEDLFTSLQRHCDPEKPNCDQAVKIADQILAITPGDEDALKCKVVALIKADKIDEALSTIKGLEGFPVDLQIYKAYCLYRQNMVQEALDCLKDLEKNSVVLQLESQIFYRLGKMDACIESCDKLRKFKIDSVDLKSNMIAALISAGRASEVQGLMDALRVKASDSFELAYNIGCSLIEMGKFADAEQQLLSARRIGQEALMEEEFAEDEIESELAPVTVQLAYARQLLGHPEEALEAYSEFINRNVANAPAHAVATNNLIALKGLKYVSDGLRKLERLMEKDGGSQQFQISGELNYRLSSRQKEALYCNRLLLLLHANRMDQARELVSSLQNMFPDSSTPVLLQAAVLVKENKAGKAEEILSHFADQFPDKSKPVLLALAQIAAAAGHFSTAAESLSKVTDIINMPATVATVVSLMEHSGNINGASSVLQSAIQWWKNSMSDEGGYLKMIMHEAASFELKNGREAEAAHLYEELIKGGGSVEALVGIVTTTAISDLEKAEAYEKRLRPLPGLKGINVESLERTAGAKRADGPLHIGKAEASEEAKAKAKSKKKRKRKPRYPKGYDLENPGPPPDPERWLPKRERSTYRPKRKDKRAAQVRGSQGAVARDKHEATSTSNSVQSSKAAATGVPKGGLQGAGGSKSRKKSRS